MADNKTGRDKQARDAERRQQQREIDAELERGDEEQPPDESTESVDLEAELEALNFPATGSDIVAAIGDWAVESAEGSYSIEELVPKADDETFDSPDAVRVLVQVPTVSAAMKRIVEASKTLSNTEFSWAQRKTYETTFQELKAIDSVDDDEGIQVISDWVVEQIHDKEKLPSSRAVRREAAKFCRANGYEVRNDEWLGI
ncbi:DUF5789 family protein [Halogeometricum limi]|uniref:Uncharacterized protein n=1 Tax=Halogeometricum limi TaxID=555875 RepID=A0A1I6GJ25_9EURY|nr:hypothetical protein [Halogeometricum limi]SFR42170.1 hypothetical protein SAMN04488124_1117 [Halogeometricum limi]